MKKNLVSYILIISLLLLLFNIVNLLNINYIKQENTDIDIIGQKVLILKNRQEKVSIPHLNVKGTVKKVDTHNVVIELSDYARTFLKTTQINVLNKDIGLIENERVFIKFNDIQIQEKNLNYSSLEIYKYIQDIQLENAKKDYFVCVSDYGGFMKVKGTSFKYHNVIYFKADDRLSENNETYFINIKNGVLLVEEIKSLIFPFKIYNMINPQETQFDKIVEIYMNKRSK